MSQFLSLSVQVLDRLQIHAHNHKMANGGGGVSAFVFQRAQMESVGCFLDDVGGQSVVAGDAERMSSQRAGASPWGVMARHAEVPQRGEEDLAEGGRN